MMVKAEAERRGRDLVSCRPRKRETTLPLIAVDTVRAEGGGNAMKKLLAWIAVTSLLALPLGAPASAEVQKFTGEVVRVNLTKGIVDLVEGGRHLRLAVRHGCEFRDEEGQPMKGLKDIQVGDYVRQECKVQQEGPCLATKIKILKRAWQTEGSPEK